MDQARFENAVALRKSGRIQEAVREFHAMQEEVADANEKSAVMINEVRSYADLGRLADAERVLERIRELAAKRHACSAASQFPTLLEEYLALQTPDYRDFYDEHRAEKGALPDPSP